MSLKLESFDAAAEDALKANTVSKELKWDTPEFTQQNGRIYYILGCCCLAQYNLSTALDNFKKAVMLAPYGEYYFALAKVYQALNRPDDARLNLQYAIKWSPENRKIYQLYSKTTLFVNVDEESSQLISPPSLRR